MDVEAYFAQEEISEYRSEYYCGEIFCMTGGTPDHNRITLTIAGLLNTQFRGRHCEAFASDMRVQVRKNYHYAYPDVVVVCGKLELAEGRSDTLVNPAVIFEVLSDFTRDYDRGSKFTAYRGIETLTDYVLVDQKAVHIEYFSKEGNGIWMLREYRDINDLVEITSIRVKLALKEIYERTRAAAGETDV